MKNSSTKLAKTIANISLKAAIKACGAASLYGCHQPKEPEALKNFKQN
ncbi:cyclic lactone autoinducer peptide [Paludicola sp. MB14-C6]|nr:cyclic lactone autoinducer peptide [Paludicola sp. MB14-C6]WMJ22354.1 cyclic lactone autoinducer peptide [Paludicola sp. MB14-C6]